MNTRTVRLSATAALLLFVCRGEAAAYCGFTDISGGTSHTCGVTMESLVLCWGDNTAGQLDAPADTFTKVTAGAFHNCGLHGDGTVTCWGDDSSAQLTAPSGIFTAISAGAYHTCGLREDGTIECWGDYSYGQTTPPSGQFTAVAAGDYHNCAIRPDATVECWGDDTWGESTPLAGTFTSVSGGGMHTCGLRTSGTVECWGDDYLGQSSPPAGAFAQISAGEENTCGLRENGTVECWGYEGVIPIPTGRFVSVSAGDYHNCGIRPSGFAECWGYNPAGQATVPAPDICSVCGDGVAEVLEQCDDSNTSSGDGCSATCMLEYCGDAITNNVTEECDDGNTDNTDGCTNTCTMATCGDGILHDSVEQCDDGNTSSGDGCSATCVIEYCGDGVVNNSGTEECDDGNQDSNDGCSTQCAADCNSEPLPGCRAAAVSSLVVRNDAKNINDVVKWKWNKGAASTLAELSDPTSTSAYKLCLYPEAAGTVSLGDQIILPSGPPWQATGTKGYRYHDPMTSLDGVATVEIVAGVQGRARVYFKGKGVNLADTLLPATSYTIQLVDSQTGICWESVFADGARSPTLFKGNSVH